MCIQVKKGENEMTFLRRLCMISLFLLAVYMTWEMISGFTLTDILKNPSQ